MNCQSILYDYALVLVHRLTLASHSLNPRLRKAYWRDPRTKCYGVPSRADTRSRLLQVLSERQISPWSLLSTPTDQPKPEQAL